VLFDKSEVHFSLETNYLVPHTTTQYRQLVIQRKYLTPQKSHCKPATSPDIVPNFMEHKGSLLYSQKPATGPYPEPDRFNPHFLSYFFHIAILPSHWLRGLPSGLKRKHLKYVQNKAITYTYTQEYMPSMYASDPTLQGISLHLSCRPKIPCISNKKTTCAMETDRKKVLPKQTNEAPPLISCTYLLSNNIRIRKMSFF